MKKILIGLMIGSAAGIIDVVPMIIRKLPWDANISAFTLWVVVGFFLSTSNMKMNSVAKGILVSLLTLLPAAILIGCKEPMSLLPISISTLILGGLSGFFIEKYGDNVGAR
jgi:hypothetical protein